MIQQQQQETSERVCEVHGNYVAISRPGGTGWTGCRQCAQGAIDEAARQQDIEARKAAVIDKLRVASFPEMEHRPKLEGVPADWIARAIKRETAGPLVIVGTVGTGKTSQACAALRHWIVKTERGGTYITAADYAVQIRSTWNRNSSVMEHDVLNRYAKAPFLVLDDLGAGREQDMEIVQGLIDLRYRSLLMRATIIVSNIAGPNFDKVFGPRAADRIREHSTIVEMLGDSLRKAAA